MKKIIITILILLGFLTFTYVYADTPGGFTVIQGGTGNTAYGQGWLNYIGTGLRFNASTSPTVKYITATSTTDTNAFAGKVSVGFGGPALYPVDAHGAITDSILHFTGTGADSGGYLTSTAVNNFFFSAGAAVQGNVWVAKTTDAAIIGAGNGGTAGQLSFFTNTGLTAAVSFSPTQRFAVGPGDYSIFGNTNSVGSASPYILSLGATYSTTCGANLKLKIYEDTGGAGGHYGYGICAGNMFGEVPTSAVFTWDINGAEKMRLDTSGNLGIGKVPALPLDVGIKDANNNSAEFIGGVGVGTAPQTQNGYELYVKAIGSNADFGFESNSHVDDFFLNTSGVFGIFDGAGNKEALTGTTLQLGSDHVFGFSSTADALVAADTGISRVSANVLGVGNGSQGDTSGTLFTAKLGVSSTTPLGQFSVQSIVSNNNIVPIMAIGSSTNNLLLQELFNNGQTEYGGPADSVSIGSGAGAGATVSILGSPGFGEITLTTGSLGTELPNTTLVTVTYDRISTNQCYPVFSPSNAAAAALSGATAVFTNHTSINFTFVSGPTALTGATVYTWTYGAKCKI